MRSGSTIHDEAIKDRIHRFDRKHYSSLAKWTFEQELNQDYRRYSDEDLQDLIKARGFNYEGYSLTRQDVVDILFSVDEHMERLQAGQSHTTDTTTTQNPGSESSSGTGYSKASTDHDSARSSPKLPRYAQSTKSSAARNTKNKLLSSVIEAQTDASNNTKRLHPSLRDNAPLITQEPAAPPARMIQNSKKVHSNPKSPTLLTKTITPIAKNAKKTILPGVTKKGGLATNSATYRPVQKPAGVAARKADRKTALEQYKVARAQKTIAKIGSEKDDFIIKPQAHTSKPIEDDEMLKKPRGRLMTGRQKKILAEQKLKEERIKEGAAAVGAVELQESDGMDVDVAVRNGGGTQKRKRTADPDYVETGDKSRSKKAKLTPEPPYPRAPKHLIRKKLVLGG